MNRYKRLFSRVPDNEPLEAKALRVPDAPSAQKETNPFVRLTAITAAACALIAFGVIAIIQTAPSGGDTAPVPGAGIAETPREASPAPDMFTIVVPSEYYTVEELEKLFLTIPVTYTDLRQPHLSPNHQPAQLCDNRIFYRVDERRVCSRCGYIFSEKQNREVWENEESNISNKIFSALMGSDAEVLRRYLTDPENAEKYIAEYNALHKGLYDLIYCILDDFADRSNITLTLLPTIDNVIVFMCLIDGEWKAELEIIPYN
jgi:hypothetical protein